MKWVTRAGANVDRIACLWQIRKLVDPKVEFLFVTHEKLMEPAKKGSVAGILGDSLS